MNGNNFPIILTVVQQLGSQQNKKESDIKGEANEDLKEFIYDKASDKSNTIFGYNSPVQSNELYNNACKYNY